MLFEEETIFTVSKLNREIKQILEKQYANIVLEGEISNFKHHSSGHMYLTLKDESSQIAAVFFGGSNSRVKFKIHDGLKVTVFGRISLYEPRGNYQFYINRMEPQGLGGLQLAFNQLKEKLAKEGLFDEKHKKSIPLYPKTVGVVTSPTGAAIQDILNVVKRRFHGTEVLIMPVRVQGETAAGEIAQAITDFNIRGGVDVMIVGRGGGSLEDLWAFNEEVVARAIFNSKIPIISAVGHETDWTIADWVADLRAPTPSAAAELVVQNRDELESRIRQYYSRISSAISIIFEQKRLKLHTLVKSYALKQPQYLIEQHSQRLDELSRQLKTALEHLLHRSSDRFKGLIGKLNALSPLAVLSRGFSVTYHNEQIIQSVNKLNKGDVIKTRLHEGVVMSQVIETKQEKR